MVVIKLFPEAVVLLHLGRHLHVLLIVLHLLSSEVLFFASASDLVSSLLLVGLFHLLFFDQRWVWLHVHWDD
jgi:hypothetical protein